MKPQNLILILPFLCPLLSISQDVRTDQDIPTKDIVHGDDVIINGGTPGLCVGLHCVDGEVFGSDTQRFKENNLRIHFDDTSVAPFAANDWRIEINSSANGGANYFMVQDATAGTSVFRIDAGAGNNAMYINSQGNVGLNTDSPALELHIRDGNSPALRLEQDNSSGFTPQMWDLVGNETGFFIRDITNGSLLPFRIQPNSPNQSLYLRPTELVINEASANLDTRIESDTSQFALFVEGTNGFVGMGTNVPTSQLHVVGDIGKTGFLVGASDQRIKKDVKSIDHALDLIMKMDGKSFRYDRHNYPSLNLPNGTQYGLIAQDIEPVAADLVKTDFMNTENREGEHIELKGIKYEQIIAILINAIKEQEEVIDQLKLNARTNSERIATLEDKLNHDFSKAQNNSAQKKGLDMD